MSKPKTARGEAKKDRGDRVPKGRGKTAIKATKQV